jgi:hypothetical protein
LAATKGKVGRVLETPRENGKPAVPRLIFVGRKGVERDFEEFMKTREDELRAAWLQEDEEPKGSGRWTEGHSLRLALRPAEPANIAAAYRRV